MSKLVQAVEGQHTTQLSLGGMVCQLCQMEFQLAVVDKTQSSGLYKQLVDADIFEQLLEVLLGVCVVRLHSSMLHCSATLHSRCSW